MKKFFVSSIMTAFLFLLSEAQSYTVATLKTLQFNNKAPTHVFIIGYSGDMGSQFLTSSLSHAEMFSNIDPSSQILYFVANDPAHENLPRFGLKVLEKNSKDITGEDLLKKLEELHSIKSLHAYSHSSIHGGIGLVKGQFWLNFAHFTKKIEKLKDNFSPDAFATLNGCNTGWRLAPFLSEKWQIPVRGSFSSTDFQQLHNNGSWYFNNSGQFPEGGFKTVNDQSYPNPIACNKGRCRRMRPDNVPYRGVYGDYSPAGGLGFAKFFCNFPGGQTRCPKIMARSLLSHASTIYLGPNPSLDNFKVALREFLCHTSAKTTIFEQCTQALLRADQDPSFEDFSLFRGNNLQCNFSGCRVQLHCDKDPSGREISGSCTVKAAKAPSSNVLIREYRAYLEGFSQLN